jgi:putative two-component system response regulator
LDKYICAIMLIPPNLNLSPYTRIINMEKERDLVLIVDDNPTNIDLLVATLTNDYRLGVSINGPRTLEYVSKQKPDIILLDIMMPGMNGFEVCSRLKADPETVDIPIIFITAVNDVSRKIKGFELGAVDYITKPFLAEEVRERVRTHLALKSMHEQLTDRNVNLELMVREKTIELEKMLEATISTITLMAEIRDPYTSGHQQRVADLACAIAKHMGFSKDNLRAVELAGILHDIGKIRVPTSVMNRPGRLLEIERELMKIHPEVGYNLLKRIPFRLPVAEIVYQHHERMDGSGYPCGLKGDQILLEARILAVADVTEAQSSYRPYRPALGIDVALAEISKNSGKLYDPKVVEVCLSLFKENLFNFGKDSRLQDPGHIQ